MPITFQERVAEILSDQKVKPVELADVADVSKGLVSQWVNGPAQSMSYDAAKRISARWGYSIDWLLEGKTPKLLRQKKSARGAESPNGTYNVSPGPDIHRQVPLISWVRAGQFEEAVDTLRPGEAEAWLASPRKAGANTYALRVDGDSMVAPYGKSYPPGCIIFVDPDLKSPANGQRIIAKLEGSEDVTFKVFVQDAGRIFLKPLNPQYPPILEPFKVLGTVIAKYEEE